MRNIFIHLYFFFSLNLAHSQDIASIGKGKPIRVSGGLSTDATSYTSSGITAQRDPFFWIISANINFDIYGVSIPFSATFSQQDRNFTQPFNQYGLSPKYKSWTLHLGYRSISFSQYTLSGNTFLGAGIEFTPTQSSFSFNALYGRFSKAIEQGDTIGNIIGIPTYERWGYGGMINYKKQQTLLSFIVFTAKDIVNSISGDPDSLSIEPPVENLTLGLKAKQQFSKRVSFDLEYTFSAFNADARSVEEKIQHYSYMYWGFIFTPNASAQFNKAIISNIQYNTNKYNLRLGYRRIDPNFRSLGTPFLNNDLEDISGNIAWRVFNNKVNLSLTSGLQRNNLSKQQEASLIRIIGGINVSWNINEQLNVSAGYSNFNSTTYQARLNQLDTLSYYQITQSANGGITFNTKGEKVKHSFMLNIGYQTASDAQNISSDFYNAMLGYNQNIQAIDANINVSLTGTTAKTYGPSNSNYGPTLGFSKSFLDKKLRLNVGATHLAIFIQNKSTGNVKNIRFQINYSYKKHHSFGMGIAYMNRYDINISNNKINELRGNVRYGLVF